MDDGVLLIGSNKERYWHNIFIKDAKITSLVLNIFQYLIKPQRC